MLNRDDVERIVKNVINGLTLEELKNANEQVIVLKHNGDEITRISFSVEQRSENW